MQDQYVFLHEVLLETYASLDTRLKLDQLAVVFPDPVTADSEQPRIDREYKAGKLYSSFFKHSIFTSLKLSQRLSTADAQVKVPSASVVL